MNKNNIIGLIAVCILIIGIFAYIDFYAEPTLAPSMPHATVATSTDIGAVVATTTTTTITTTVSTTTIPTSAATSSSFVLSLNQSHAMSGYTLVPYAVIEDSRCPINVQCIQAGRVVLGIQVDSLITHTKYEMKVGDAITIAEHTILFKGVTPSQEADMKIKESDYRFTFVEQR